LHHTAVPQRRGEEGAELRGVGVGGEPRRPGWRVGLGVPMVMAAVAAVLTLACCVAGPAGAGRWPAWFTKPLKTGGNRSVYRNRRGAVSVNHRVFFKTCLEFKKIEKIHKNRKPLVNRFLGPSKPVNFCRKTGFNVKIEYLVVNLDNISLVYYYMLYVKMLYVKINS
jgi:hypothetical protein